MTAPAIATHNLTCMYGPQAALNNVTLSVEPGSVYALVGSNGAGKTTLIELLMNLMRPASGAAELLGIPVGQLRGAALNRIGYVAESQDLPEWMTVEGLLDYLRPFYPTWDVQLEAELVGDFGLPMRRKLKQLSRGMKMKAAFIGALSYRPELLVLDEPFSGLDPLVRDELIQSLVERIGETTLFLSSHDLAEVEGFASHVGYLEDGSLLFGEEMASLNRRFRQVEFAVDSSSASPPNLPPAWMEFGQAGSMMRFTHSRFVSEAAALAEIRALVPSASEVTFSPMSLKSIFMVQARTHRKNRSLVDSRSSFGGQA